MDSLYEFKKRQLADQIYMTYGHPLESQHHQHQARVKAQIINSRNKNNKFNNCLSPKPWGQFFKN